MDAGKYSNLIKTTTLLFGVPFALKVMLILNMVENEMLKSGDCQESVTNSKEYVNL